LSPFVAGVLPFGGDSAVATLVMKADRWNAGIALMQVGNRKGWRGLADASKPSARQSGCWRRAGMRRVKAKKEHRCMITVPAQ
jgi:hypothetical protein